MKINMWHIAGVLVILGFILFINESEKITTANGNEVELSSLVGMNVFDVAYRYSKSSPETLTGTNNQRWVVYYRDINVTLETKKSNNIVQKAKKGRKAKRDTWAN